MPKSLPPIPITFTVVRDREPVVVTLDFADDSDILSATRWSVPSDLMKSAAM